MKTVTLNNGVEMPMFGLGTNLANGTECIDSILTAIDVGYRLIDTAEMYGNEEAIGEAIAKCGVPRTEIFLTTKVMIQSFENARASVEASLKKFNVDYIDLVLLHWPFGNYYAAWRDLEKLYHEGKIRAIGVSNFDPDRLIDLIHFNEITPAVNQIETHLYCQRVEDHKWLKKLGIQHQAYTPLGTGQYSGLFTHPTVVSIAEKYGKTAAQVALRHHYQNDVIAIPKSVRAERIKENFDIFDFELTEEDMQQLRAMDKAQPFCGNAHDPRFAEWAMKGFDISAYPV